MPDVVCIAVQELRLPQLSKLSRSREDTNTELGTTVPNQISVHAPAQAIFESLCSKVSNIS